MKNPKIILALLAISIAFVSGCNKKDFEIDSCAVDPSKVETREINIASFERLKINGPYDVKIQQGTIQKVITTLETNLIDNINKSVVNKEWKLEFVDCGNKKKNIPIYITMPDLKNIEVSGGAKIQSLNQLNYKDLLLSTQENSQIDIDISCESITTIVNGVGEIKLKGTGKKLNASILGDGTGYQLLTKFIVPEALIHIIGSGESEVSVTENLNVTIEGSGKVYYTGSPTVISSISGSGTIEAIK